MKIFNGSWISRVGIVVIAAVMVEIISIIQYRRVRSMLGDEMDLRSQAIMTSVVQEIEHVLELTESTLAENEWDIERNLNKPDSLFPVVRRLIDNNEHVVGGCLAFLPYYYSSKGRLFEPYAFKDENGSISLVQLGGPDHDYTRNEEFKWSLDSLKTGWTDPYLYGPDSLSFTTYKKPIFDADGRLATICGLDLDLSWLGETLNAHQPFPSSFGLLLTREGRLVAGPSEERVPEKEVETVVDILNGRLSESDFPGIAIRTTNLSKDPFWQLALVHKTDEVFARMYDLRRQQFIFMLLGLAIMAFMVNRYSRNESKLRKASEEQARISGELAIARDIQLKMLPKEFPADIFGTLDPALEVGGDLFDFHVRDGKLFFCIGDVSGKGVPSAMLMSVIHSLFRMISMKEESPSRILSILNRNLCNGNDSNMFVTFFAGCLDLYTGKLNYCNAGHDKPFLLTSSVSLLQANANLPLGVFPTTEFEEQSIILAAGTSLFLYTDGLTEAKDNSRKNLGRPRVQRVLEASLRAGKSSPEELVTALRQEARVYSSGHPQNDDLTLLCLRFQPSEMLCEKITLSNNIEEVSVLSDFVKNYLGRIEMDRMVSAGLRLALEEAVVNVMNYAYPPGEQGEVVVYADSNFKEVRFTVVDSGFPFDPTSALAADVTLDAKNRPIGGLGIHLTRKLVDSVSYCWKQGNNVLTLTKKI